MWRSKLQYMNSEGTWFSSQQEPYHKIALSGLRDTGMSFAIQMTQEGRWDSHQLHLSASQESQLSQDSKSQASESKYSALFIMSPCLSAMRGWQQVQTRHWWPANCVLGRGPVAPRLFSSLSFDGSCVSFTPPWHTEHCRYTVAVQYIWI